MRGPSELVGEEGDKKDGTESPACSPYGHRAQRGKRVARNPHTIMSTVRLGKSQVRKASPINLFLHARKFSAASLSSFSPFFHALSDAVHTMR